MQHDPIMFFRDVLRSGDHAFIALLVRILRRDPALCERADRELHALPRLPRAPGSETPRVKAIAEQLELDGDSA